MEYDWFIIKTGFLPAQQNQLSRLDVVDLVACPPVTAVSAFITHLIGRAFGLQENEVRGLDIFK